MATKKSAAKNKHADKDALRYPATKEDCTREQMMSQVMGDPAAQAAMTLAKIGEKEGGVDVTESMTLAMAEAKKASQGDLSGLERMLSAQATTLDVLFNSMTRRAAVNAGEYLGATETYTKLALRAQAQCRATITALAEIKNPKAVFVSGQANISSGHQQVNNYEGTDSKEREAINE